MKISELVKMTEFHDSGFESVYFDFRCKTTKIVIGLCNYEQPDYQLWQPEVSEKSLVFIDSVIELDEATIDETVNLSFDGQILNASMIDNQNSDKETVEFFLFFFHHERQTQTYHVLRITGSSVTWLDDEE